MIFILDNFDSFTYNLFQYFGQLQEKVTVRRQDQCTLADIAALSPDLIVISPGPCTPADAPLALAIIEHFKGRIPILGICLGHQAIGQAFGATIVRAKTPMHGKISLITHDLKGVFEKLPNPLTVTRYHSLAIAPETLPDELLVTAQSEDGEIMGVRHRDYPIEGVQFHPEAILTEAGHKLLANALDKAREWKKANVSRLWHVRPIALSIPPVRLLPAFDELDAPFFLDSGKGYSEISRYSYMGAWPFLIATATQDKVELYYPNSSRTEHPLVEHPLVENHQSLTLLDTFLAKYKIENPTPFPFAGGAVGFLSYDLKDVLEQLPQEASNDLEIPLWRFAWYDGIIVYDHQKEEYYLTACGMNEEGQCFPELAEARLKRLEEHLLTFTSNLEATPSKTEDVQLFQNAEVPIQLSVTREHYYHDLERVIEYILAGDIYQANLTQRFGIPWTGNSWQLYQALHENNPAPFAAFLPYADFQVLCSSPERFISIDIHGKIETRPIKGTRPRGDTPETDQALAKELLGSVKDRAELTMIIDLERNDMGRISQFNSVRVEDLIRLEQYPTVWHLVSTITGQLQEAIKPSEILAAIFPGGSITGAPKIRAMEIIEELEPFKRGIYTGSIGYLGFDGAWDLNIVIRTIVLKDGVAYIHAGGGIVADSIPELEYEEVLHKAQALFRVLGGVIRHE